MSIAVVSKDTNKPSTVRPRDLSATSQLFSEMLDGNHDAWTITRPKDTWFFYREIGGPGSQFPCGAVVLSQGPHPAASFNF
jgi:hypothetical protein